MEKNIEITNDGGLKCDNLKCDWVDSTIGFDVYKEWINKSCPKCGENVLTEEDYKNVEIVRLAIDMVNNMSEKELDENVAYFKALKGDTVLDAMPDNIKPNDMVKATINTHKEIKITDIKKINKDEDN